MSRTLTSFRLLLPLGLVWLSMLALWAPAWAQESELRIAELSVEGEALSVTVEGPSGLDQFAAMVDGASVEPSIERVSGTSSTVVFAVETSSSMHSGLDARALEAVRTVLDGLPAGDSVALITFGTEVEVLVSPTNDHAAIVKALAAHEPSDAASLYTGVHTAFSLTAFSETPSSVVVITRGWNFSGSHSKTSAEALAAAEASGAAGFVVALGSDLDAKFLDAVAALGGLPRGGDGVAELGSISAAIEARRGSSYELVVPLAGLGGGAHELLLSVAGLEAVAAFETVAMAAPVAPTEAPTPAATAPPVIPTQAPTSVATAPPVVPTEVPTSAASTSPVASPEPAVPGTQLGPVNLDDLPVEEMAAVAIMLLLLMLGFARWLRLRRRHQGAVTTRLGVGSYDVEPSQHIRIDSRAPTEAVPETPPTTGGEVPVTFTFRGERHEISVGAVPTTVGSSTQADLHLDAPGAPFLHSILAIENGRPTAFLLASGSEGPRRIVLDPGVSADLGGARIELPNGATAAA